jgi:hypothetical protein
MTACPLSDLCASHSSTPLHSCPHSFVAETDIAQWCDAAAQAYLLGDGQTLVSTIVKASLVVK